VRSAVLNQCRSVLRRRAMSQAPRQAASNPESVRSAESAVLTREERDEIMRAVRQLPPRQREVLVLRFYLDLSAEETATTMGISPSSVRSATHRALASLGCMLQEQS
jgi:RNA polymerase sigma factor (sigma-70 family)